MSSKKNWSKNVTQTSDALDLEPGIFTNNNPTTIAKSLIKSAKLSKRRKATVKKSAISMISFYINRAGKNLSQERIEILNKAKQIIREILDKSKTKLPLRSQRIAQ